MNFTAKTEKQLNEENRLPDGEYDFEVLEAVEKKSRQGSDMIEVKLKVWTGNGDGFRLFTDFLLEAMAFKLLHFCEVTGLSARYVAGTLTADDCKGRAGKCQVGWQKSKDPAYPDKNVIKDYVTEDSKPVAQRPSAPTAQDAPIDDDVPF